MDLLQWHLSGNGIGLSVSDSWPVGIFFLTDGGELVDSDPFLLRGIYVDFKPPKSGLAISSFELLVGMRLISAFFTLLESFSEAFWRDFSRTPPSEAFLGWFAVPLLVIACFADPEL